MHAVELSKKSLDALAALDYPNFELIVVDNCSTDGSGEIIEEYVKRLSQKIKFKFIKTRANLGWTGGINAAYNARDSQSEYISLTQNDLVARCNYLTQIIPYMQSHRRVGVVQGIIAQYRDNSLIDSVGLMADESLNVVLVHNGEPVSSFKKPTLVSYVEGAMPVYRVDALKQALGDDKTLFITSGFIYYLEDIFVSLMLWQKNFQSIVLPIVAGEHNRKTSSGRVFVSLRLAYFNLRNQFALLYMTNSQSKIAFFLKNIRKLVLSSRSLAQRKLILESLINGVRLGRQLKKKYGTLNLYAAPLLKTRLLKRFQI
jgi:GT2 family glycosyltransferase